MNNGQWRVVAVATLLAVLPGRAGRSQGLPAPASAPIGGRVVDERGAPVAGATVRLYRRESQWSRRDPEVEQARSAADGGFRLATPPLEPAPPDRSDPARLALVVEHPGHALGWAWVPDGPADRVDVRLTADPVERAIAVTDADGKPLPGALVVVYGLGDLESPVAEFRRHLELRPSDGPLTAVTDANGRARFASLPRTKASFVATKPGFAATFSFTGRDPIRLTPGATLGGTLTGPDGSPLAGIRVKLKYNSMWEFEVTRTDDQGRYRFDDQWARGWDMSAWGPGQKGDGSYRLWIEGDRFAVPTQSFALEPNERRVLDLRAQPAGVIRVEVLAEETGNPVPNVRVWGFDHQDGTGRRFDARTDGWGFATFHAAPAKLSLSIAPPPDVYFTKSLLNSPDAGTTFDFPGGEWQATLTLPRIGGRLVAVDGECVAPDGKPATGVRVLAVAEPAPQSPPVNAPPPRPGEAPAPPAPVNREPMMVSGPRRADAAGRFALERLPAGRGVGFHALAEDGTAGGWLAATLGADGRPVRPIRLVIRPTVAVDLLLSDDQGRPLPGRECKVTPRLGDDLVQLRRSFKADDRGQVRIDGVIPGLSYHVVDEPPAVPNPRGGLARGKSFFDRELILSPDEGR